jgi:hypothetical protein
LQAREAFASAASAALAAESSQQPAVNYSQQQEAPQATNMCSSMNKREVSKMGINLKSNT